MTGTPSVKSNGDFSKLGCLGYSGHFSDTYSVSNTFWGQNILKNVIKEVKCPWKRYFSVLKSAKWSCEKPRIWTVPNDTLKPPLQIFAVKRQWKCIGKPAFWVKVQFFDCNSFTSASLYQLWTKTVIIAGISMLLAMQKINTDIAGKSCTFYI